MMDFLKNMRDKVYSDDLADQYSALLFVLQLPSICSRIEIPQSKNNTGKDPNDLNVLYKKNGKPFDKNMYFAWLKKHKNAFTEWYYDMMPFDMLCGAIYNLRNQLTHTGNMLTSETRLVLLESKKWSGLFTGHTYYMSRVEFCDVMFDAVDGSFIFDNTYNFMPVLTDTDLIVQALSDDIYTNIKTYVYSEYRRFWQDRDSDLHLYQTYYSFIHNNINKLESQLKIDEKLHLQFLSCEDTKRLVKIFREVETFGKGLDERVSKRYLNALLFS